MTRRKPHERPPLTVTRDDDGGLTIHDPQSDLVVSIIASHPNASGPRGLTVEVYAYQGGDVLANDIPQRGSDAPVGLRIARHLMTTYYAGNDR